MNRVDRVNWWIGRTTRGLRALHFIADILGLLPAGGRDPIDCNRQIRVVERRICDGIADRFRAAHGRVKSRPIRERNLTAHLIGYSLEISFQVWCRRGLQRNAVVVAVTDLLWPGTA